MDFVGNFSLFAAVKKITNRIRIDMTELYPWLRWHSFLTHSVYCIRVVVTVENLNDKSTTSISKCQKITVSGQNIVKRSRCFTLA